MLPAKRFNGQYGFSDFFNDFFENRSIERMGGTTPAINVKECDKGYILELAAPGACKDCFKIHLNKDGNLVIEMEVKDCGCEDEGCGCGCQEEKKDYKYIRKEFSYSRFSQTILLPDNADKERIEAHVNNGILKVEIPKLEKPKVEEGKREIEVK